MNKTEYFLYAGTDKEDIHTLETLLGHVDQKKQVIAVPNGYDLINFLQMVRKGDSYPCLIILNKNMLRLDGKATLELLKSDDIYCLIPTVMFATDFTPEETDFCNRLGADVISKPVEELGWQNIVEGLCSRVIS